MHIQPLGPLLLPSEPRGRRESARSLIGCCDFHFDPPKCTKCAENTLFRASRQNPSTYRSETCGAGRRISKSIIINVEFVRIDPQLAEIWHFNFDPPFCTRSELCHFSHFSQLCRFSLIGSQEMLYFQNHSRYRPEIFTGMLGTTISMLLYPCYISFRPITCRYVSF